MAAFFFLPLQVDDDFDPCSSQNPPASRCWKDTDVPAANICSDREAARSFKHLRAAINKDSRPYGAKLGSETRVNKHTNSL